MSVKHPTLDDVAQASGFSKGTVSNVLNQKPWVHPETVRRVRAAIAEVNYGVGNEHRRPGRRLGYKLRNKRTSKKAYRILFCSVGMPRSLMSGTFYGGILYGVEAAVSESRGSLHIRHLDDTRALEQLLRRPDADGVIVINAPGAEEMLVSKCPVVKVLGSDVGGPAVDCVDYCADRVAQIAARYLHEKKCKEVVVIGPSVKGRGGMREAGFLVQAKILGMNARSFTDPGLVRVEQRLHAVDPERLTHLVEMAFKTKGPKPDGIFALMDMIAPYLYPALAALNIKPGVDVPIISCNNEQFVLAGLHPKPATIDIYAEEIGKRAVSLLEWRMRYPSAPLARTIVEPRLIPES